MAMPIVKSERWPVRSGEDIVRVRQIVRRWAVELGFGLVDQTKIVTAASEIARNTVDYGGGARSPWEIPARTGAPAPVPSSQSKAQRSAKSTKRRRTRFIPRQ